MWPHFETFHVFQRPTYQAKYPPAQGAFLALGGLVGGHEIVGVWLSFAAAIAALSWMLAAESRWPTAVLIAATAGLQPALFRDWGNTYWGGAVAMLGGALLWGGILRLRTRIWWPYSLATGMGLLILSQSRQLEGAIAGMFAMEALVLWTRDAWHPTWRKTVTQLVIPLAVLIGVIVAWTLVYNAALSGGNPFKLAYLNWQPVTSPVELVRDYTGATRQGFSGEIAQLGAFFITPWMAVLLLGLFTRRPTSTVVFAVVVCLALTILSVAIVPAFPHYLAPVAPLLWLLFLQGWKSLRAQRQIAWRIIGLAAVAGQLVVGGWAWWGWVSTPQRLDGWQHRRHRFETLLQSKPGPDLVLVSYGPDHSFHKEWVYNAADIDKSPVVWARSLSPAADRQLVAYFDARNVWRVEADEMPPRLEPYRPGDSTIDRKEIRDQ